MLERAVEPLAYETAFWLQGVEDPTYPLPDLGKVALEVGERFRALAIIALVTAGSVDGFCHNLIRSGRVRLRYLRRVREEGALEEHHYASGRYAQLLDAVAAGDVTLAREIAHLSPREWRGRHEYLDDYCFAQVVQRLILDDADEEGVRDLLARHEAYLEGAADARLAIGRALVERDPEAFAAAFEEWLLEREGQIAADVERGRLETPTVVAERRIFVDGLALLRIAGWRGVHHGPREYKYCPSLALAPMRTPFPGE